MDSIRRGAHFPSIDQLTIERECRLGMLKRWGFTKLEEQMEDETLKKQRAVVEQRRNEGQGQGLYQYGNPRRLRDVFTGKQLEKK